jgi:hypothetical protein
MTSYQMARRAFLRGCGGSLALLAPLLRGIEARAQGMPAPLRFLIIQRACGTELDLWRPTATATTTTFTLPLNSAPFTPLQSKMVMIDGLNLVCVGPNGGGQYSAEGGMVALMTGAPTLGMIGQQDHVAGGPSIDQLLLARSPSLGGAGAPMGSRTLFGSLVLSADNRSDRDEVAPRVLSYLPPTANPSIGLARQPLYPETQPLNTFIRLFGGAVPAGTNAAALLAQKLSVLDFMRSDLTRLRSLIPTSEKVKVDTHEEAIQHLEASLRASLPSQGTCVLPARPPMFVQNGGGPTGAVGPAERLAALRRGRLRAGRSHEPSPPGPRAYPARAHQGGVPVRPGSRGDVHVGGSGTSNVLVPDHVRRRDASEIPYASLPAAPHYEPLSVDPATPAGRATLAWGAAIDRFYNDQTSQALQAFDAAIDLDGNTLLDNTVVSYVSDESTRWDHGQLNMPLIVLGGKNTRLKGGRFLKVTGGSLPMQLDLETIGGTGEPPLQ